jgi:hypothetical protein
MHMEIRNRDEKTGRGHESSFSLTRQAQTNHYDRRIIFLSPGHPGGRPRLPLICPHALAQWWRCGLVRLGTR